MKKEYDFSFGDNTLFLEFQIPILSDTVQDAVTYVENTFPNTKFRVVAIKNIIGYWSAYDTENGNPIYCEGTMSKKTTREKIKKYLDNETESSSN